MKKIVSHTFDTLTFEDGSTQWVGLTFVNENAPMVGDYFNGEEVIREALVSLMQLEADVTPKKTRTSKKDTTA